MSHATVRIPTPLRSFTGGADELRVDGRTVGEAMAELGRAHAGLLERILDARGELRPFVRLFVGEDDVRHLDGLDTAVAEGAVICIVPAVAGGRP